MSADDYSNSKKRSEKMDNNIGYILFICVVAPMISLLFVAEEKMRRGVVSLLIGMFACL